MHFAKIKKLSVFAMMLALPALSQAVPTLQLGITDGTWKSATETTYASNDLFTLNAYLTQNGDKPGATTHDPLPLDGFYYFSFALLNKDGNSVSANGDYGFIKINGLQFNVTADMEHGTPPLDLYADNPEQGDLQPHSVFPTYYNQFAFNFVGANQTAITDLQNSSINPLTQSGSGMYYKQFAIDTSNLKDGYGIHFDLYRTLEEQKCTGKKGCTPVVDGNGNPNVTIEDFAPFSHDASSGFTHITTGGDPRDPKDVPEPATLALFGLGLLGFAGFRRKAVKC